MRDVIEIKSFTVISEFFCSAFASAPEDQLFEGMINIVYQIEKGGRWIA
jgi:hypothetical protein